MLIGSNKGGKPSLFLGGNMWEAGLRRFNGGRVEWLSTVGTIHNAAI